MGFSRNRYQIVILLAIKVSPAFLNGLFQESLHSYWRQNVATHLKWRANGFALDIYMLFPLG